MFQLIMTVMSIALAAGTALITLSYLDPTIPLQKQAQQRVEEGFSELHSAWDRYRDANEVYQWVCDTHSTAEGTYEDCQKELSDPGYLEVLDWQSELIPAYTFMPRAPEGMSFIYQQGPSGWYFCAEGQVNEAQAKGIYRAEKNFPVDSYFVSSTCGGTSSTPLENLDLSAVKVTYYVKRT